MLPAVIPRDIVPGVTPGHARECHGLPAVAAERRPRRRLVVRVCLPDTFKQPGTRAAVPRVDLADRRIEHFYRHVVLKSTAAMGTLESGRSSHKGLYPTQNQTRPFGRPS